jgi:RNA-directed DNA polymerase
MSEHRASFEKGNADAEPVEMGRRQTLRGQTPSPGIKDTSNQSPQEIRRSNGDGMGAQENRRNTGGPSSWEEKTPTGAPRGEGPVTTEIGEAHSSEEASNDRGAKEPQFQGNETSKDRAEIGESLPTPEKLWELQETLYAKAKGEPVYRFYALYDKLHRLDVLAEAWRKCRDNGGTHGVDGESFDDIEARGINQWLGQLAAELKQKTYQPGAVRRVMIPKPNGKQRPLGIPTIRDRVVQTAAVLIIGPIFEADLADGQYAYRAERSAHEAIVQVHSWLNRGMREVVDADLSGYFDTIPHPQLMKSLARRISDGAMLALLKKWLEMPVEESDGPGGKRRSNPAKRHKKGTPQGAPISPLLSNLYMRRFIQGWKQLGYETALKARIVNFADDFVILCANTGKQAEEAMRTLMGKLHLEINSEKTRLCRLSEETFDFLGYTFGRCHRSRGRGTYIGTRPSSKKIKGIIERISHRTERSTLQQETAEKVMELNAQLRGWGNYFCFGAVSKAYRAVDAHARHRLRQWLRRKHKHQASAHRIYPYPGKSTGSSGHTRRCSSITDFSQ